MIKIFLINVLFLILMMNLYADIVDEFYNKILQSKIKGTNNKILLIRKLKIQDERFDNEELSDTSLLILNKSYNHLQTKLHEVFYNSIYRYKIDNNKQVIIKEFMVRGTKYPELYTVIDLNGLSYYKESNDYVFYTQKIEERKPPLISDFKLYYFSKKTSMLEKIEYFYTKVKIGILELKVEYQNQIQDNVNLFDLFSTNNATSLINSRFKNFKLIDEVNQ